MRLTRKALIVSMAAALVTLGACGGPSGGGSQASRENQFRRGISANPDSVDPQKAQGTWENDVIGDMFIGLFTEDAAAKPIPGVAESWTTSEDGLTWTFKLKHTNWSDGVPLTAKDFVFAFQRLLNPKTLGAVYASIQYPIKNAQAVNGGSLPPDQVGVHAIDDYTLEIQLEHPMPNLPALLKHYTAFPIPQHAVEKYGDDWTRPEHIVVNGPYKLAEWRSGDYLRSVKNDAFADAANICFKEVIYFTQADHDAMVRRAQAGEIDMNNSFPSGQLDQIKQKLPGWPRVSPMTSTTYIVVNTTKAPFNDTRVRQALAMAMDREYITGSILRGGQLPSYSFVPKGMNGYPEPAKFKWAGEPRDQRMKEAVELLKQAGYGPDKPLEFEYLYRSTGDNPRIAPVLQANWQDLGPWVHPQIRQVETKDLYKQEQEGDFTIADSGWVVDYNDPYNFLYLLDSRTGPMNYGRYHNPEYDALISKALDQTEIAQRSAYLKQAEQLMLDDTAVLPMLNNVAKDIVSPEITGFEDNVEDIHRSRYMCRKGMKAG